MLAGKEGGRHKLLRIFHRWMRVGKGETLQSCILHLARDGERERGRFFEKNARNFFERPQFRRIRRVI